MSNPARLRPAQPTTTTTTTTTTDAAGIDADTARKQAADAAALAAQWEQVGNCSGLDQVQATVHAQPQS
jgi:hypothetical protein